VRKFLVVWERDARGEPISGLSTSQSISLPLAALMVVFLIVKLRKPAEGIERATGEGALVKEQPAPAAQAAATTPTAPPPAPEAPAPETAKPA
jgi:hypothetical protein